MNLSKYSRSCAEEPTYQDDIRTYKKTRDAGMRGREEDDAVRRLDQFCVRPIVLNVLRNHNVPIADYDALIQDIFLHALVKIDQLEDLRKFPGWVRKIAFSILMNHKKKNPPSPDIGEEGHGILGVVHADPSLPAQQDENRELMQQALCAMRAAHREVLTEFYFEHFPIKDIASKNKLPVGTVKRRLFEARAQLRQLIEADRRFHSLKEAVA